MIMIIYGIIAFVVANICYAIGARKVGPKGQTYSQVNHFEDPVQFALWRGVIWPVFILAYVTDMFLLPGRVWRWWKDRE